MISKTLGHYQITNQLGKGGMGEVYQAKDRKFGRDVANGVGRTVVSDQNWGLFCLSPKENLRDDEL